MADPASASSSSTPQESSSSGSGSVVDPSAVDEDSVMIVRAQVREPSLTETSEDNGGTPSPPPSASGQARRGRSRSHSGGRRRGRGRGRGKGRSRRRRRSAAAAEPRTAQRFRPASKTMKGYWDAYRRDLPHKHSWKKSSSCFASSTPRFPTKRFETFSPSPQRYNPKTDSLQHMRSSTQASCMRSKTQRMFQMATRSVYTPSPCSYDVLDSSTKVSRRGSLNHSFRRSPRFHRKKAEEEAESAPSVFSYDPLSAFNRLHASSGKRATGLGGTSFKSRVPRFAHDGCDPDHMGQGTKHVSEHVQIGTPGGAFKGPKHRFSASSFGTSKRETVRQLHQKKDVPGPGRYSVSGKLDQGHSFGKTHRSVVASLPKDNHPGPGAYLAMEDPELLHRRF